MNDVVVFDLVTVIQRDQIVAIKQAEEVVAVENVPGFAVPPQFRTTVYVHLANKCFAVDCAFEKAVSLWTGLPAHGVRT
jgi:hypothetical protein